MPSEIANFDARMDWRLSEADLISLSVFSKDIENPYKHPGNSELNQALQKDGVSSTDGNTNTLLIQNPLLFMVQNWKENLTRKFF